MSDGTFTIDGVEYSGTVTLAVTSEDSCAYGEFDAIDTTVSYSAEWTMELADPAEFRRAVGDHPGGGHVTIERLGNPHPGRRCLWGWRKGYVQVGSERDLARDRIRIDIPNVRWGDEVG